MADAKALAGFTPQERFLYYHHMDNMLRGTAGATRNPDGTISTVLQTVVKGPRGKFYSIPSVWDGKILSEQQAMYRAGKVGWDRWPSYKTTKEADARYMQMHSLMEQDNTTDAEQRLPLMPFQGKTLFTGR